jgi:hypothetical protein
MELGASTGAIKRRYRRLARKWHPDTFPHGSPEQDHASKRMQEINDAYRRIRHAPLRYYRPTTAQPQAVDARPTRRRRPVTPLYTEEELRRHAETRARAERSFRFAIGFGFGCFVFTMGVFGMKFVSGDSNLSGLSVLISATLIPVGCGFLSVRCGDGFWKVVIRLLFPHLLLP